MVRLISRQRGGLAALKLIKLFGIDDFPAAKDSGKVLIIIIYCYLIIIVVINKMEFRDAIKLRYDWRFNDIPTVRVCGDLFVADSLRSYWGSAAKGRPQGH